MCVPENKVTVNTENATKILPCEGHSGGLGSSPGRGQRDKAGEPDPSGWFPHPVATVLCKPPFPPRGGRAPPLFSANKTKGASRARCAPL